MFHHNCHAIAQMVSTRTKDYGDPSQNEEHRTTHSNRGCQAVTDATPTSTASGPQRRRTHVSDDHSTITIADAHAPEAVLVSSASLVPPVSADPEGALFENPIYEPSWQGTPSTGLKSKESSDEETEPQPTPRSWLGSVTSRLSNLSLHQTDKPV